MNHPLPGLNTTDDATRAGPQQRFVGGMDVWMDE